MKKLYILLITILTIGSANAQWQKVGLNGNWVYSLNSIGNTIYAGTLNQTSISTNNGINWTTLNNGLFTNIQTVVISGSNCFIATDSGVFLSTNNGVNWTAKNTGLIDSTKISSLAISGSYIYASSLEGGVYRSSNNGVSWITVNSGLTNLKINSLALIGSNIFAIATKGNLYELTNNGNNWSALNPIQTDTMIWSLKSCGNNLIAGSLMGNIYLSIDSGNSWNKTYNPPYIGQWVVVGFTAHNNYLFSGTMYTGVFLSTDNGSTWISRTDGIQDSLLSLTVCGNYIYAGTWSGVYRCLISDLTSIVENKFNNNISIYPIPTSNNLTIETNSNTKQNIEILNLLGQTLYTSYIYSKATIDVSAFANGVYIIKLNSDKGIIIKKFIKQ